MAASGISAKYTGVMPPIGISLMVPRFFPHAMDEPSGDRFAVLGQGLRGTTDGTDIEQYEEAEREIDDAHAAVSCASLVDCNPARALPRRASVPGKENPASAMRGRVNGEI